MKFFYKTLLFSCLFFVFIVIYYVFLGIVLPWLFLFYSIDKLAYVPMDRFCPFFFVFKKTNWQSSTTLDRCPVTTFCLLSLKVSQSYIVSVFFCLLFVLYGVHKL